MAETLCTLRTKGGGVAKQTETVLWTNPSPSSSFAGQTVTLSDDIKNYDYVGIRCSAGSNYPNGTYIYYKVADILSNQAVINTYKTWLISSDQSTAVARYRQFTVASNGTDLTFSGGYRQNNVSNNNDCIPFAIIGIKAPFVRATYNHYYKGYFTSSVQSVDLGFVPRYVIVYNSFKTTVSNGTSNIREYDAEVSTTQFYFQGSGITEMRNIGTIGSNAQFCMEGTVIGTGVASATFANFIDGKMHITAFG